MKEIEILVEIKEDIDKILPKFDNFKYVGIMEVVDEYYYDPKREDLKPDKNKRLDKCLRFR